MRHKLILLALLLGATYTAASQDEFSTKLDETIISQDIFGNSVLDTPKNVTVITAKDIEEQGAQNIEQALKIVPGVAAYNNVGGMEPKISFRGMAPGKEEQNILYLVDGLPYNSTVDTAGVNLNLIPIDSIERIEIVPNSGNILYGEGAVAGIINIITKQGENKKYYGDIGFEAGSYNLRKYKVNVGSQINNKISFNVRYNSKDVKGYRQHDTRNIDYLDLHTKYKFDTGSLTLNFSHAETDYKFPGAIISKNDIKPSTSNTKGKEKLNIYKIKYQQKLTDNLDMNISGDYKDKTYKSIDDKSGKRSTLRDTDSFYITPQFKYSYLDDSYFILGGDFSKGTSKYTYKTSKSTDTKKDSLGIFATNTIKYSDFLFTQGIRHQKLKYDVKDNLYPSKGHKKPKTVDQSFDANSYELTGSYIIDDTSSIYLSYNRAFRAPTANEAGLWRADYDVNLQTSDTFEMGTKGAFKNLYWSGAIYQTDTKNEIFYVAYEDGKLGKAFNLPGKNKRKGIEILLEEKFDSLSLRQGFSYVEHKITSGVFKGNKIPGVPNIIYNLGLDYSITENLTFNTNFYYYGSAYATYDFHNSFGKQKGHNETDIALNYKMNNGLTIYGGINNLFDKEFFNAKVDTNNKIKYFYGARRNYYVGLKYNF